jgi:hypothetical protein
MTQLGGMPEISPTFHHPASRVASMRAFAVLIIAAVAACHGGINNPPDPDGVDNILFEPPTAAADGATVVALTVIDTITPPADTKVALTSTIGTFLGGTTTITVALNDSGRAFAQLKAPSGAGTAVIAATAAGVTKYFQVPFTPASSPPVTKGITALIPSPPSSLADGATVVTIKAVVDTAPRPNPYTVTLTTTAGTFLGTGTASTVTVPVGDSGFARAQLRAPSDSSIALVTATTGGVTRFVEVRFDPAPPNAVQLSGDFAVKAGPANSATITVQLLRAVGVPSPGVTVRFSADTGQGSGGAFGQFSPRTVVSSSPTVTTRFTAGETSYRGPITVRVQATRGSTTVTDSTIVQVVSP